MAGSDSTLPDGMYAEWQGRVFPATGTVRPPNSMRLVTDHPEEGFEEVTPGRFRRIVPTSELTALFNLQTYCTWMGIRCAVRVRNKDGTLHVEWTGGNQTRAEELGFEWRERGIFYRTVPESEVTDLHQERREIPLA